MLRDLTAAALGRPWRLSPNAEDTLYGLMVLADAFSRCAGRVRAATEGAAQRMRNWLGRPSG